MLASSSEEDEFLGFRSGRSNTPMLERQPGTSKLKLSFNSRSKEICGDPTCGKILSTTDNLFECNECKVKFHPACTKIKEVVYKLLLIEKLHGGLFWRCRNCVTLTSDRLVKKTEFTEKMDKLSDKINSLNSTVDARLKVIEKHAISIPKEVKHSMMSYSDVIKRNIKENNETKTAVNNINESVQQIQTNLTSKFQNENSAISDLSKTIKKVKSKLEETAESEAHTQAKARKANNVCVFNLPESSDDNAELSFAQDVQKIKIVLGDYIRKDDIKQIRRIAVVERSIKPRPLIITFSNSDVRAKILKLWDLKYQDSNQEEHRIFIKPDMTKKEQMEHKQLVKELQERRAEGELNLVIRNGRIISKRPFLANPSRYWDL